MAMASPSPVAANAVHVTLDVLLARQTTSSFTGFPMFPNGSLASLGLDSACETVLYETIYCDDETAELMTSSYLGSLDNATLTSSVCDSGCGTSLAQLHDDVATNCGAGAEFVDGLAYLDLVDMLWSNWNQSCFVDPDSGDNCNGKHSLNRVTPEVHPPPAISHLTCKPTDVIAALPNVTDISELDTVDLCSYCYTKKLSMMQSDAYSAIYEENWQATYEYVATTCNLTVTDFNATDSIFNVTIPTTTANCVSGNTYQTVDGDTCDAIALANHVSAATMFYNNPNILNYSAIAAGTSLCLPLACNTVYTVQENDTCSSIAADNGLLTADVVSFNTQINWNCTNLHSTNPYWGTTLCVSTPGGTYTAKASNGTTTTSDTTSAVDPPSGAIVANGTTTDCGQWYVDDGSLTCTQVCLSYAIAINLFVEANPSLNKTTCDSDMIVGDAYCIDPLDGWDLTRTSDTSNSTATATATATATGTSTAVPYRARCYCRLHRLALYRVGRHVLRHCTDGRHQPVGFLLMEHRRWR